MKKTVKEWLDTLPKELRNGLKLCDYNKLKRNVDSLSSAVFTGFMWHEQKGFKDENQSIEFWHGFYFTLMEMEQLDRNDYELKK